MLGVSFINSEEVLADENLVLKVEILKYKKALSECTARLQIFESEVEQINLTEEIFKRANLNQKEYKYDPNTRKFSKK